jgi:steroid 5-alpha reductase family enzyme
VAAFAVAGWIWALSSDDMPDALWVLTAVLSIAAVGLAVYALTRGRRRGANERRY